MSEYRTREILDLIEANGGPEELDLSYRDLSDIDLSRPAVKRELAARRDRSPDAEPAWLSSQREIFGTGGINLGRANLKGARLTNANLQYAYLSSANLENACLEHADLRYAHIANANLQRARLEGAKLQHTDLRAFLQNADLLGAELQEACLNGAKLQDAILIGAKLKGAKLWGAELQGAKVQRADLQGVLAPEAKFMGAYLDHANLRKAEMPDADLSEASLQGSKLSEAILSGARLQNAWLTRADLRDADLTRADLRTAHTAEVDFRGADLRHADLREVDLHDVESLQDASFYRAKLHNTSIRREDLGDAIGDERAGNYQEARAAYFALKQNFANLGDHRAASWAYVRERRMETACSAPWRARQFYGEEQLGESIEHLLSSEVPRHTVLVNRLRVWSFLIRHTEKWASDSFVDLLCHYGEGVRPVLFWMALLLLGSPLLFGVLGLLDWPDKNAEIFFSLSGRRRHLYGYFQHFLYILDAFTSAHFAELEPASAFSRVLSGCIALIGIFLTGLLGFVVGNRIRRS